MSTVVILLSDKRSGSTMLQKELCRHSAIQHVSYSPHTYFETHHWLKAAVLLGRSPQIFSGGQVYKGYGTPANARTYIVETVKGNVPDFQFSIDDRKLVFDGWEALCDRFSRPIFFEKSPQTLANWAALDLFLEWMSSTDFKVKVIGLVRNPMAVQYSAEKLFSTDPRRRQFGWLESCRNLLTLKSVLANQELMVVRYEDLVNDPKKNFSALCEFIGVEYDQAIGSEVRTDSIESWRSDPDFTLQLDPSVVRLSKFLGYSEMDLFNPNMPDEDSSICSSKVGKSMRLQKARLRDRILRPLYYRVRSRIRKK